MIAEIGSGGYIFVYQNLTGWYTFSLSKTDTSIQGTDYMCGAADFYRAMREALDKDSGITWSLNRKSSTIAGSWRLVQSLSEDGRLTKSGSHSY